MNVNKPGYKDDSDPVTHQEDEAEQVPDNVSVSSGRPLSVKGEMVLPDRRADSDRRITAAAILHWTREPEVVSKMTPLTRETRKLSVLDLVQNYDEPDKAAKEDCSLLHRAQKSKSPDDSKDCEPGRCSEISQLVASPRSEKEILGLAFKALQKHCRGRF